LAWPANGIELSSLSLVNGSIGALAGVSLPPAVAWGWAGVVDSGGMLVSGGDTGTDAVAVAGAGGAVSLHATSVVAQSSDAIAAIVRVAFIVVSQFVVEARRNPICRHADERESKSGRSTSNIGRLRTRV
jgi:hypothetical protein